MQHKSVNITPIHPLHTLTAPSRFKTTYEWVVSEKLLNFSVMLLHRACKESELNLQVMAVPTSWVLHIKHHDVDQTKHLLSWYCVPESKRRHPFPRE